LRAIRTCFRVAIDAFLRFSADDGWAIASHIALSVLMAMFPFVILVTALAGFIGSRELADEVARLIVAAWPPQVSGPIADQIHTVLTTARGDVLTLGAVFALYFSSSGVESLRIGLNRAYGLREPRPIWLLRLESIGYVLISAVSLLVLSFFVVLGPLVFRTALTYAPWLDPLTGHDNYLRLGVAALVIALALFILHVWLPAGRRRLRDVWPGIAATLVLWLACGFLFGRYLAHFSSAYVTYYAGLASVMIALVFLYFSAWIFIFGGELNAAITRERRNAAERGADVKVAALPEKHAAPIR
jgi:membrane protein